MSSGLRVSAILRAAGKRIPTSTAGTWVHQQVASSASAIAINLLGPLAMLS